MDQRLWLFVPAAAVIAGLCLYKATRTYPPAPHVAAAPLSAPAPAFELYDQETPSHLFRLVGRLGRQQVLVVFFDGRAGADRSAALSKLREEWSRLQKADMYVVAISTALPQENRKVIAAHGAYPFPLLSDPDLSVHRAWGRFDAAAGKPRAGVFLIDRKGSVAWSRETNSPQPLDDWENTLSRLLEGL